MKFDNSVTRLFGIDVPIIGAPMFLVSWPGLVAAVSEAGGLGTFPALNYRTIDDLEKGLGEIRQLTNRPFGVNIILHKKHNPRWQEQFDACVRHKVPVVITSMGTPRTIVRQAREAGIRVLCDVTTLRQAKVVEKSGADALIAVCQGAGGHAGQISPFALIPQLKKETSLPVIAAGSITDGRQMAAALALGADGVYVGTRLIATNEAGAKDDYKHKLIECDPDDIVYTDEVSGVAANWIKSSLKKKSANQENMSEVKKNWLDVWSAGHGVAQIESILPAGEVIRNMAADCLEQINLLARNYPRG